MVKKICLSILQLIKKGLILIQKKQIRLYFKELQKFNTIILKLLILNYLNI